MPQFTPYTTRDRKLDRDEENAKVRFLNALASDKRSPVDLPRNATDVRVIAVTDNIGSGVYDAVEQVWDDSADEWIDKPGGLIFDGQITSGRQHRQRVVELRSRDDVDVVTSSEDSSSAVDPVFLAFRFLGDGQEQRWFFHAPESSGSGVANSVFAVDLTEDGGSDGDATSEPTYTYTATSLDGNTTLGTNLTPKKRQQGSFVSGDGKVGLGYKDENDDFQLYDANESRNLSTQCT